MALIPTTTLGCKFLLFNDGYSFYSTKEIRKCLEARSLSFYMSISCFWLGATAPSLSIVSGYFVSPGVGKCVSEKRGNCCKPCEVMFRESSGKSNVSYESIDFSRRKHFLFDLCKVIKNDLNKNFEVNVLSKQLRTM